MYSDTDECKDNIISVISEDIISVIQLFAAVFVLVFVAKFFLQLLRSIGIKIYIIITNK